MNKATDERIREKLLESEYMIPASYDKKINETIERIKEREKKSEAGNGIWLVRHKVAGVILAVLALSVISVSSYATVNMFRERMVSLSENIKDKYNRDVQESNVDADVYSRELTKSEEETMLRLREQYEKNGLFPKEEAKYVERREDVRDGVLCFSAKESKFYLPERMLTEEEMLEIIDLQEKRDYSVREKNKGEKSDGENGTKNIAWEKEAVAAVENLYPVKGKEMKVVSSEVNDGGHEIVIGRNGDLFSVYFSEKCELERIVCNRGSGSAHKTGIKMKDGKIKALSGRIKKKVERFTGKTIREQGVYSLIDTEGNLAYGTISWYCGMSDGSGCVGVYSMAYRDLYDIYVMDSVKSMKEEIAEKIKKAEKGGCTYKLLK